MNKTAYLLTRLAIGTSMSGHGFVRLFKLNDFTAHVVQSFEKSMLPGGLVTVFGYVLPFAEFITGALLLIGLFTKQAAVAGCCIMFLLLFGSSMIENWSVFTSQLMHVMFFVIVIQFIESNSYAIDNLRKK